MSVDFNGFERIPPHSLEAEVSTIGSLLIDREAIAKVVDIVKPESFYKEAHRHVYSIILDLFEKGEPVDYVTVTEELRRKGFLDSVGGIGFVTELSNAVPTSASVEYYAK